VQAATKDRGVKRMGNTGKVLAGPVTYKRLAPELFFFNFSTFSI